MAFTAHGAETQSERPRARDIGVVPGVLPTGPLNAITDVQGVRVGHVTLIEGDSVRTGVTAILPHSGNLFQDKVPAAIHIGNAFGKLVGSTQVEELGFIETPIILTNTLSVWEAANAVLKATTVSGRDGRIVEALSIERVLEIGRKYNRLHPPQSPTQSPPQSKEK